MSNVRAGVSSGFSDKLYWRTPPLYPDAQAHCFKRQQGGGYVSLCGKWKLKKSGGQGCQRPPAVMRCGWCDGAEMKRRGWEESGPESPSEKLSASNGQSKKRDKRSQ